jgi:hypothetical protein
LQVLYRRACEICGVFTGVPVGCAVHFWRDTTMMDLTYLLILIGFFAVSAAVVYGCERLRRPS